MENTVLNKLIAKEVTNKIYESNAFLDKLKNVTEYLNYNTVTLPAFVGNSSDSITMNGSNFSWGYNEYAETSTTFTVDVFRLKPTLITNHEAMITSYDKFNLVLREKINKLADTVSKRILWTLASDATFSNAVSTSGSLGEGNGAGGGNKKMARFKDLIDLKAKFDGDSMPEEGRWLIVDHIFLSEMLQDSQIIKYMEFGKAVAETGQVDKVLNFNLIVKPTIAHCGTAGVAGYGVAPISTDSRVCIAFSQDIPVRAMSDPKVLTSIQDVHAFGDLISAETFAGVKNPRIATDNKGVYLIKQG
jgi:hypothetical protein